MLIPEEEVRAFWVTGPSRGTILPVEPSPPGPDDVDVEALWSGISRGTETLVFRNEVPVSQYQVMRCPFQEGGFPAPVKYGYALVGRVAAGPPELLDRDVFVLHPHQTRCVVPAAAVVVVPESVPPARAVLAANMETALNGVWDAAVRPGDRLCVIGAGVIGLLAAYLATRIVGVEAILVDIDPGKAALADRLGIAFREVADDPGSFDVIIHASGDPGGLRTALALAGFEATIVEMSWFGKREVALPLGEAFHSRRLVIRSSQVGAVAPAQRGRWSHRRRLEMALGLLADDRLDHLISGESAFATLPEVMSELAVATGGAGRPAPLCHRIRY